MENSLGFIRSARVTPSNDDIVLGIVYEGRIAGVLALRRSEGITTKLLKHKPL